MPRARRWAKLVNWQRQGGRLARLDGPAEIIDSEVMVYNILKVQEQVLKSNTIQQPCIIDNGGTDRSEDVRGIKRTLDVDIKSAERSTEGLFSKLPPEILEIIFTHLSVKDMEALVSVNIRLKNHIESRYILHLMLPCSSELMEIATRKKVLKLTSTRCLFILKHPITGELPFKHLNLRYLKELKLGGYNFNRGLNLSGLYLSALKTILTSVDSKNLQKLEISCDNSDRLDFFIGIVPKLLNLKEITLRGMNLESSSKHLNPDFRVVESVLRSTNVEKVSLERFAIDGTHSSTLSLASRSVQELNLDLGKLFDFQHQLEVDLPYLTRVTKSGRYCLFHALKNQLKFKLAFGAPKLQFFNDLDLNNLPGKEDYTSWLEQLKAQGDTYTYCNENRYCDTCAIFANEHAPKNTAQAHASSVQQALV